jgi:coenzyme F420-0:L-glutamate ligase / coenzyme F420-1:gamma-L-glutamate ligase
MPFSHFPFSPFPLYALFRIPSTCAMNELLAFPVRGLDEIRPGDSLEDIILRALEREKRPLAAGDILVVTHKIVSKAEGHIVPLSNVRPSEQARRWARAYGYDPRLIELALAESKRIVRKQHGVLITETRHGLVCANNGVDVSNVDGGTSAALLPPDPDRSAAELHKAIKKKAGLHIPVIVTDSFGRPWREGLTEVAIGVAGMRVFRDFCGRRDPYGYRLRTTLEAVADELACVAGLVSNKLSRRPVCIIRGFPYQRGRGQAKRIIRPSARDLFR